MRLFCVLHCVAYRTAYLTMYRGVHHAAYHVIYCTALSYPIPHHRTASLYRIVALQRRTTASYQSLHCSVILPRCTASLYCIVAPLYYISHRIIYRAAYGAAYPTIYHIVKIGWLRPNIVCHIHYDAVMLICALQWTVVVATLFGTSICEPSRVRAILGSARTNRAPSMIVILVTSRVRVRVW